MFVLKMFRQFTRIVALSAVSATVGLVANQAQATNRYFDINGTTAGSGVAAAGAYSWESAFWNNNDATGTTATTAWTEGDFPRFSAGTDGNTKTYTVTASANHTFAGMFGNGNSGTIHVNTTGGAVLTVSSGLQGMFVGTNTNLYLDTAIAGTDATSALQWSGGGGSLFLYGANTFQGGVSLNSSNGLNFNNAQSFGAGPITWSATSTLAVLANPDTTAPLTITNSMTMQPVTAATKQIIYTGHDAVTFPDWTLGDSPAGFPTFGNEITVANNAFTTAKLIINNLKGTANSNLIVGGQAATNGTLVLTGTSTYGGAVNGGTTIIGSNTTGNPALQADDGAGLPTNSFLLLNGGVLQTSGSFTRPLAASFGNNVAWNIGGGGFSAIGSQLTVDIGGAGAQLLWGDSTLTTGNPDLGVKILGPLKFGSVGSNAKTTFIDPIDLNPAGVASPARTVTVTAGVAANGGGGDSTEMSGLISSSADPGGSPATLIKNGTGTLILSGQNTYAGATTVAAGTLSVANIGLTTDANSNIGVNNTIHLGATTVAGTLKYTGTGQTTDKTVDLAGTTGGGVIDQSGTGLLKFTSNLTGTGVGAKTLTLQGSTAGTGEFDGLINDAGGGTGVTKAGTGTWTLAGANGYTGTTAANAGILILANASAMPSANALSLGGGTLRNSTGGLVTVGGATSLTTNSTIDGANGFTFNGTFTNTAAGARTLTNNSTGPVTLAGTVNLSNSATARVVTIAGTGNTSITGVIANGSTSTTSGLTKSGASTLTLTNANTYGGTTTISTTSTLLANNSSGSATGTGGVTVSAGGILGGTGTISGAVANSGTINGNGLTTGAVTNSASSTLSPGGIGTVATLNVGGNLTDSGATTWAIDLSGSSADKLAVTGNVTLSAGDVLSLTGTGTGTSWLIGTYSGTESGGFGTIPLGYSVSYTGGNITLNVGSACAPGDLNCDGHVDAQDYVFWRKTNGSAGDFTAWRANFGVPAGAGSGGGLSGGGAVPEPSPIALLMLGLVALACWRGSYGCKTPVPCGRIN